MSIKLQIGNENFELAANLRVIYSLREITGAKNIREALKSLTSLDLEDQIQLLYAAYKANNKDTTISAKEFEDKVIDNLGIFAIADVIEKLADNLMYAGLSKEQVEEKKSKLEKMSQPGETSSDSVLD